MDEQRLRGAELAVGERLHRPEGRGLRLVTQEMVRVIRGAGILVPLVRRGAQARRLEEIELRRSELIGYLDAEDLLELWPPLRTLHLVALEVVDGRLLHDIRRPH